MKGVSSWNFDVADLKAQAALEPDVDSAGWDFDVASSEPHGDGDTSKAGAAPAGDGELLPAMQFRTPPPPPPQAARPPAPSPPCPSHPGEITDQDASRHRTT